MSDLTRPDPDGPTALPELVARRESTAHDEETRPGLPRDPAIQHNLSRRLTAVALLYAGTYTVVHVVMLVLTASHRSEAHDAPSHAAFHIFAVTSTVLALVVAWLVGTRRVGVRGFPWVAAAVQVFGTVGILGGYAEWPKWTNHGLADLARILGTDPVTVIRALDEALVHPIGMGGIAWSWVWLLIVPLVVPLPARAVTVGSLLSAGAVPAVLLLGGALGTVSPELRQSVAGFIVEVSVPSFVVAAMAIAGSRVVFKLTRELSRAREMGSYRLVEKIGEGGMGEVWRAEHRMLARPAAIKLVKAESLGGSDRARTALRRFEREAQVIATLTSPHTVSLYDFGVTDAGRFYYVMELLDGIDLRTLVERFGPQPPGRVRHFLLQACHSLSDAHRAGVLHRDVKPGNLFACRRGSDVDFIKVLDFGLVKEIGSTPGKTQLTMEGITTGTPAFMAPEMAIGAPVDARTDIYALGCVGFWLLTGRLVFEGDSAMAIIAKHVSESPPAPSSLTELEVPDSLDRILMECLEKDPEKRPADARDLARRLEQELIASDWTSEDAAHWWDTHFPASR